MSAGDRIHGGRTDGRDRKQAVLLIHGIGEQRPMDSLREFVQTVWTTDPRVQREHGSNRDGVWSKPYALEENFELRRLTTAENRAGVRTDFFEFYWAHLMSGTQVSHVVAWARTLLWRNPKTVPDHLRLAYTALWGLVAFGVYMVYRAAVVNAAGAAGIPVWTNLAISLAVLPVVVGILTNTVGDAARYLHVAPPNVQRRHEIRSAGIRVLKSLHENGYDRIVVVGHSLGSVIGYDVLNHAWSMYNTDKPTSTGAAYVALTELEDLAVSAKRGATPTPETIHRAQRRYLEELRGNGGRWRVSDFITLGSPLAHAEILLAPDADSLKPKFANREFPTCPPALEESQHDKKPVWRFSYPPAAHARVPHHGAVFAPVRWTNMYFPNRLIVWGDLVGGKLQPIFGPGVRDIAVTTRQRAGLLSHTLYWRPGKKGKSDSRHVTTLRDVLDLLDEHGSESISQPVHPGQESMRPDYGQITRA